MPLAKQLLVLGGRCYLVSGNITVIEALMSRL